MTQAVAGKTRIHIAGIIQKRHPLSGNKRLYHGARRIQQRAPVRAIGKRTLRGHRYETVQPAATQQLQKKRLDLILAVMRGEQHPARRQTRRQCLITQQSRLGFQTLARCRLPVETQHLATNPARRRFTHTKRAPLATRRRPAMIDITGDKRCRKPLPLRDERLQQRHAVAPTA